MAKTEGIELRPDGTVELTISGTVRHLRRPVVRELRGWTEQIRELAVKANEEVAHLNEMIEAALAEETPDDELGQMRQDLTEAQHRRSEYLGPWIASVVSTLSDKPLPDDVDEWPAWLVMDLLVPTQLIQHWRTAPLVRSGPAKT